VKRANQLMLLPLMIMGALLIVACGSQQFQVPPVRTVMAPATPALLIPVDSEPSLTALSLEQPAHVIFWSTDDEPERVALYEVVAARYMAQYPDVTIEIVPVDEAQILAQLEEAYAAGQPPDLVRIGVEGAVALAGMDLLDTVTANQVVAQVGIDDFRPGPRAMATLSAANGVIAVPFDGWTQAIWYRHDRFEELGLAMPNSWEAIDAACDAFAAAGRYALTLPTAPTHPYVHQVFEQVAMSNNAWPFAVDGQVSFNTPSMIEALRFYTALRRCAPQGAQGFADARAAYLLGETSMLWYSTYIMNQMVNGVPEPDGRRLMPVEPDLAQRSSFAPALIGPGGTASYGQLTTLAIIQGAHPAVLDVATYFMTAGYLEILALAPFGKAPVLASRIHEWERLSPVFSAFSPATLDHVAHGYDTAQRWILRPDYTAQQRALIGEIEGRLLIPQAIHAIAVEGRMSPEVAAAWLQLQVEELARAKAQ
jgi:multiple sugar transport system substrate-binding protein